MPISSPTFAAIRALGLTLPGVTTGTTYGSPALKVRGRMFACIAIHRSAEPNSLAVRMPFTRRDQLIADDPKTYYLTPHYVDYPCVLARWTRLTRPALRELLEAGFAFVSEQTQTVTSRTRTRRARAKT